MAPMLILQCDKPHISWIQLGRTAQALDKMKLCTRATAHKDKANVLLKQGRCAEAWVWYTRAILATPTDSKRIRAVVHTNRSLALHQVG